MLIKKALIVAAAAVALTSSAFAQKFASVDMQRASQNYWRVTSEQERFNAEQRRLQDLAQTMQGQVDTLMQERETALQDAENPGLSADRQEEARQKAKDIESQIMNRRETLQIEQRRLQGRAQETQRVIEDDIRNAVKTVAQRNAVDVVFPAQVAVYSPVDLTDQVIKELNSSQPATTSAAPAAQ